MRFVCGIRQKARHRRHRHAHIFWSWGSFLIKGISRNAVIAIVFEISCSLQQVRAVNQGAEFGARKTENQKRIQSGPHRFTVRTNSNVFQTVSGSRWHAPPLRPRKTDSSRDTLSSTPAAPSDDGSIATGIESDTLTKGDRVEQSSPAQAQSRLSLL
jgi:hypothetical protein